MHGPGVDYTDRVLVLSAIHYDLSGANFTRATMLPGSIFNHAKLIGAELTDANFSNINFSNADLSNALLLGADFSDAMFNVGTNVTGAFYSPSTIW